METPGKKPTRPNIKPLQRAAAVNPQDGPADRSINAVAHLERETYEARSRIDHLSSTITKIAGSGTAIFLHAVWFSLWLAINLDAVPGVQVFDPFPFSFLTMIVSLEAIFLTLFVLVSQNRMSLEADKRDQLDLQVNLLAEREATMILRMLSDLSDHWGVKGQARADLEELLKETNVDELAKKLAATLPSE